jgi:hypothetical protein
VEDLTTHNNMIHKMITMSTSQMTILSKHASVTRISTIMLLAHQGEGEARCPKDDQTE